MELKFFKCTKCGKIIAMVNDTGVSTICCGQDMVELKSGTTDAAIEKHVPVVTVEKLKATITVGSIIHPMEEKHFIEWIALVTDKGVQVKTLKSGDEPKADFALLENEHIEKAYAYCNLHSLWASK